MAIETNEIIGFISLLNNTKNAISMLFAARPDARRKHDILDYITKENYEQLILISVLTEINGNVHLDERVIVFFEDFLERGEVKTGDISDIIAEIGLNIKIYESSKNSDYLKKIKRSFENLDKRITISVIKLFKVVDETFKNERHAETKKIKLEDYKEKRETIWNNIVSAEDILANNKTLFAIDADMSSIRTNLSHSFAENKQHLTHLQGTIINYLNKVRYQTNIYKKIQLLKALKDNKGGLDEESFPNLLEIANNTNALFLQHKKPKFKTLLPLGFLLDDEGRKIVDKIRNKLKIDVTPPIQKKKYVKNAKNTAQESINKIDIHAFLIKFLSSKSDLFDFIMNYSFSTALTEEMNFEKKVNLYVQIATDYDDSLNFTNTFYQYNYLNENNDNKILKYHIIYAN